jgi:hypothetical protein
MLGEVGRLDVALQGASSAQNQSEGERGGHAGSPVGRVCH